MSDAIIIPFPERNQRPETSDFHTEMLYIELESLERRVESIKRSLGILATENGVEE